jgi:hypothetical protein
MSASTTPNGSSLPFSLSPGSTQSSDSWREDDLRRALRHHTRALRALRGSAYETLSDATRRQLIEKLENDWAELKRRLRAMGGSPERASVRRAATSHASSSARDDNTDDRRSWMERITSSLR